MVSCENDPWNNIEYKYLIEELASDIIKRYRVLSNDYLLYRLKGTLFIEPHFLHINMFCLGPFITQRRPCVNGSNGKTANSIGAPNIPFGSVCCPLDPAICRGPRGNIKLASKSVRSAPPKHFLRLLA